MYVTLSKDNPCQSDASCKGRNNRRTMKREEYELKWDPQTRRMSVQTPPSGRSLTVLRQAPEMDPSSSGTKETGRRSRKRLSSSEDDLTLSLCSRIFFNNEDRFHMNPGLNPVMIINLPDLR